MSFLQGVTNFLESVDQKAGEMAESRRRAARVLGDQERDDADDVQHESTATTPQPATLRDAQLPSLDYVSRSSRDSDSRAPHHQTASSESAFLPAQPSPPPTSSTSGQVTIDQSKVIQSLLQAQAQAERRHEAALADRQNAYAALESSFLTLQERYSAQQAEIDALRVSLESTQRDLRAQVLHHQELQSAASSADAAKQESHFLQEELSRVTQERQALQAEVQHLQQIRKRAEADVEAAHSELAEYRRKAKLALEERDRALSELHARHATAMPSSSPSSADDERLPRAASHAETAALQAELARTKAELETLRHELRSTLAAKVDAEGAVSQLESLVAEDRCLRKKLEVEIAELERACDLERRAHYDSKALMGELRAELDAMKRQQQASMDVASVSPAAQAAQVSALELRIRELAELLMEKQAALEAKRSESDQWRTRFDVSQQRLREAELLHTTITSGSTAALVNRGGRAITIDDDPHDEDVSKTKFMKDLSRRGAWGAKVVDVAQGIDRVSLQTGSVLRRHSLLRVGILLYVLLLHLWVFFAVTLASPMPSESRSDIGPKL